MVVKPVALRGYPNQSLSSQDGGTIYNKFSLELRYPITLGASAKIYALAFLEGGASYDNFRDYNPFQFKTICWIRCYDYLCLRLVYWELILVMGLMHYQV